VTQTAEKMGVWVSDPWPITYVCVLKRGRIFGGKGKRPSAGLMVDG